MDTQPHDTEDNGSKAATSPVAQKPLDLLRRVLIPIERETANGTTVFRTTDKLVYARLDDGSIRRAIPKMRGKQARRDDKVARRQK